ncbi:MAG: L-threonylcarbamoyladenylate synthase [Rickettsiales bacterium]|nr:L-threonylcarbamoyladenylate synthase [Rickettsiales bacterium]
MNDIKHAAELLQAGELVAFPTETVYGLGADACSDEAVAKIYETKGRPSFNPLIVHVTTSNQLSDYVVMNANAQTLATAFWPGPLTLVLPRSVNCPLSLLVSAGLDSVAMRIPAHPVAHALLQAAQMPIAAPSANRSGRISPTQASHVRDELGESISCILEGGDCQIGLESTVIDLSGEVPRILRPGSITKDMIESHIGPVLSGGDAQIKSPGMLESHYAPSKPLRLNATNLQPGEALLAFGDALPTAIVQNLSAKSDLREAAAHLFKMLRLLDASDAASIAVMPIPEEGLGIAINDRLRRAAAPRHK